MGDKDDRSRTPLEWLWHGSLMILGAVLALHLAIRLLEPIWPWLAGAGLIGLAVWIAFTVQRWRDRRW